MFDAFGRRQPDYLLAAHTRALIHRARLQLADLQPALARVTKHAPRQGEMIEPPNIHTPGSKEYNASIDTFINSMTMRVLHVVPSLGPGGAERVLLTMIRELQGLGIENSLCVIGSENAFPARIPTGCNTVFFHYDGSWRKPFRFLRCALSLRRLVERNQPDIVHSHLWPAVEVVGLATRGLACEHVVHIHDSRPWLSGKTWRDKLRRAVNRGCVGTRKPTFICVSEAVRVYTHRHMPWVPQNAPIIFNGFDQFEFGVSSTGIDSGKSWSQPPIIGAVGRLIPEKGHAVLLEAAANLKRRGYPFILEIAGDGSLLNHLQGILSMRGLEREVKLRGRVDNMAEFYQRLNIFAFPSVGMEGLPMVLLEAMAYGLPIVTTDVSGPPEAIKHRRDGLVVRAGDAAALADALASVLEDQSSAQALGQHAAQRVRREFTGAAMARGVASVYQKVLHRHVPKYEARHPIVGV